MKLSVPGVYAAPRTLADKSVRIYYYHRATGVRLPDDPASRAFLERVLRLDELIEQDPQGGRAAARALFPGRKTPQSLRALHRSPPHPAPAPVPADRSGATVKPKLPDGCFKLLFDRFEMSTEFTDLAESTRKEYARHMRHLEPALGLHPVSALSADLFDKLVAKFNKHPTLQKAIRRTMSVLLGYAMRILKWIPANPLLGVQKIKRRGRQEAGARMPLSEPAIARFRRANPFGSRARLIFELALPTALRRGDLARVPAEDIEAGEIMLRTGKSGIPVVARATEHLVLALRAFRANHPEHAGAFYALGAQSDGQPIHKRTISADFAQAAKQAAFSPQERLHALRYTAATRLCELGLHYEDIAEVTGHAMASMARHYCRRRAKATENAERLKAYGEQPHHRETLLTLDGTVPMGTEAVVDAVANRALAASRKTADAAPRAGAQALAPRLSSLLYDLAVPERPLHALLDWAEAAVEPGSLAAFELPRLQAVLPAMLTVFIATHTYRMADLGDGPALVLDDTGHGSVVGRIMALATEVIAPLHGEEGRRLGETSRRDLGENLVKIIETIERQ